jgi:hypothetical protein
MEPEIIMPIVRIQHAVFVEVSEELPVSCPHCHAWFEDEDANNLLEVRMQVVNGATRLVLGTGELNEVLDGYDDNLDDGVGKLIGFICNRCKEPVIWTHTRTWTLEVMHSELAAQLKTLLYDINVKNPIIKRKVFSGEGYRGSCEACNIEASIGTEEVPHPIDARLHTCRAPNAS